MKNKNFQDSLRTSISQLSIQRQEQDQIRDPPQKIRQNKFTKTYSKLQHIPLQRHIETLHPKNIQHLYISHNRIKSLQGIEEFENLISLNVSYNLLTKIEELSLIKKPQNILRIGLKMNDFVYGYEDYAVYFFKNLHKLDDIHVKDKSKVKKLQEQGERVAGLFLEFYIRVSRIFLFLDDLIKQEKVHQEMRLTRSSKNKINPKLKLLFEHMTKGFIAKISSIYAMPTQEEFLQLPTAEILNKIEQAINFTLRQDIDLKCTCRPRKPYQQEVKDSFKEICSNFLTRFASRYNSQLKNGLKKIYKKFNSKLQSRKLQQWQLWGMLQNYRTLTSGGKNYQNLTSTIGKTYVQFQIPNKDDVPTKSRKQKIQQNQWRNKVFLSQQNSQNDKQNLPPNISRQTQQKRNNNFQDHEFERVELFYNRIPIILYEKNYVEVLLQITMEMIKNLLEKYDYLNKVRTKYFLDLQKQKKEKYQRMSLDEIYTLTSQKKIQPFKSKSSGIQNEQKSIKQPNERDSSMKETKRAETSRNEIDQLNNLQGQIFFKKTLVQNSPSPSDQIDSLSPGTTQRRFLKRQQSQISFGITKEREEDFQIEDQQGIQNNFQDPIKVKDHSIYEINLIYKVFRAFKINIIKRKNKRKAKINRI